MVQSGRRETLLSATVQWMSVTPDYFVVEHWQESIGPFVNISL